VIDKCLPLQDEEDEAIICEEQIPDNAIITPD